MLNNKIEIFEMYMAYIFLIINFIIYDIGISCIYIKCYYIILISTCLKKSNILLNYFYYLHITIKFNI